VLSQLKQCDGFMVRVNPGKYAGVTQSLLDKCLVEAAAAGKLAMSHPDVVQRMGAKDALVKIKDLSCGMTDTYAYYDIPSFKESFPKTVATGTRVLKQNRGSQGEGIWVVSVKPGQKKGPVTGKTMLVCQEAKDNHIEEHTVDAFMKFCEQYIVGEYVNRCYCFGCCCFAFVMLQCCLLQVSFAACPSESNLLLQVSKVS
jgi:glutathione synthase/RimK-type ligase-like ATP-grasp enzyme